MSVLPTNHPERLMRHRSNLKTWRLGANLAPMAAARLAAVLLVILGASLTAQTTSTARVVITVTDQSGAVIRAAHVGIIGLPSVIPNDGDWVHYALHASEQASAHTDANGEATVGLVKGSYVITITALGFSRYFKKIEIRDESNRSLKATLGIFPRSDCMGGADHPDPRSRWNPRLSTSSFLSNRYRRSLFLARGSGDSRGSNRHVQRPESISSRLTGNTVNTDAHR
jgi:hypothetical protein